MQELRGELCELKMSVQNEKVQREYTSNLLRFAVCVIVCVCVSLFPSFGLLSSFVEHFRDLVKRSC